MALLEELQRRVSTADRHIQSKELTEEHFSGVVVGLSSSIVALISGDYRFIRWVRHTSIEDRLWPSLVSRKLLWVLPEFEIGSEWVLELQQCTYIGTCHYSPALMDGVLGRKATRFNELFPEHTAKSTPKLKKQSESDDGTLLHALRPNTTFQEPTI
jgi:hypothetical protein